MSRLVAHFQIFRRLMKGKFDAYVLCTFGKKVPKLNSRPVYCSRLYGTYKKTTSVRILPNFGTKTYF